MVCPLNPDLTYGEARLRIPSRICRARLLDLTPDLTLGAPAAVRSGRLVRRLRLSPAVACSRAVSVNVSLRAPLHS